ncbi:GNAT family N-acetyltransferase [Alteromonas pelagimontana]|uniref:GNAT family N-acetyltransferase n=1 Tax=Alteromonas pelagimontana TaxID=1858656 RepID=A0A6M4MDI2_9ALTE|nr:GNAT family N-acetyltransferase [Alteromonas pelagimontana]QJR81254.1 GNAT family N-acetyltransferase [Alteromonas pelagimontana]
MEAILASPDNAEAISSFYKVNTEHLRPWEPRRNEDHHFVEAWKKRLASKSAFYFIIANNTEVLGICALTNIVRGPFQACNIGYAVSAPYEGKGLMQALCKQAINYAFDDLCLNRIMANYMPQNRRSEELLRKLGFVKEGFARKYLKINGQWEDHVLTSLVNGKHR